MLAQLVIGDRVAAAGTVPANRRCSAEAMTVRAVLLSEVPGFAVRAYVDAHGSAWLLGRELWGLERGRVAAAPRGLAARL